MPRAYRSYRAEMLKLRRRGTVIAGVLPSVLAVLTTVLVFTLAKSSATAGQRGPDFTTSLDRLSRASGLSTGFALGMSLVGLVVLVVTIAHTTGEYSLGTLRTAFIAQPNRRVWLGGRLLAMGTVLVVSFAAALITGMLTALVLGRARGIDMHAWFSAGALQTAGANYLNALIGAACFALAGTALAVLMRSTVVALAVAIAWTFPIEHIIQNAWPAATEVFPGLLFATVAVGGSPDAAYATALPAAIAYGVLALLLGMVVLSRRDVTA